MAHLIVGEKDCEFNLVLREMKKATTFDEIVTKRGDIAVELNIGQHVQAIIRKNYNLLDEGALPIMQKYLVTWKGKSATNATLGKLLDALDACDLNEISEMVRKAEFYLKSTQKKSGGCVSPADDVAEEHTSVVSECQHNSTTTPTDTNPQLTPENQACTITNADWEARILLPADSTVSLEKPKKTNREGDSNKLPGIAAGNGVALILNIIKYGNEYRKGAQYDSFLLTQILIQLGYKVVKYDDCNTSYTKNDVDRIIELFREYVNDCKPASMIVFVGCHGENGRIQFGDEDVGNILKTIVYPFGNDSVVEEVVKIPKIFIVQGCRDWTTFDKKGNFPEISNTVVCYATIPGNPAARFEPTGCPYVRTLVKVIAENAHCMDWIKMLNETNHELKKQPFDDDDKSGNIQNCSHTVLGGFDKFYFKF